MSSVCFYFQVHQPHRLRKYDIFDIGNNEDYFADASDTSRNNEKVFKKVSRKSYLPTNEVLLSLLQEYPELELSFSFSGIVLEQMQQYQPEVLESFQKLVDTGQVEVLAETYHHSLAFFFSKDEFNEQVDRHISTIQELFGITPTVFRNTELAYNNNVAQWAQERGFDGVLAEGWDDHLGWRSPNFVYKPAEADDISLLLKNYKLSDDIAFRFSQEGWEEWPLTAEKFAQWIHAHHGNGETINLFMDYETFGEHQWEHTGIFDFLKKLPEELLRHPDTDFKTPSHVIADHEPHDTIDVADTTTWADTERDLSAWLGNEMQQKSINALYELEDIVKDTDDLELIENWRRLQTSDHFYYMCTKWFNDGDVHAYFNPYDSPYDAFISYMNALQDLQLRMGANKPSNRAQLSA